MSGRRVVVGYDGSQEARAAVAWAVERVGKRGHLTVVCALDQRRVHLGPPSAVESDDEHARALLDSLALSDTGHIVDTRYDLRVVRGHPADAIVGTAAELGADEIVMGSRGLGRVRAALGSVSHEVLHKADRPVVVVPHGTVAG